MIAASELLVRACLGYLSAVAILLCICKFYLKELRGVSKLTHISHLAARGALLLFLATFCWLTGILCGMSAFASLALTVASRFSLPWQSVLRLNPDTCLLHFPISTPRTWATFVQDGSFTWPANEAWLERFLGNAVLNAGGGFSTTLFSPLFTLSQSPGFLLFSAIVACTWFAASYKCLELFLQHV